MDCTASGQADRVLGFECAHHCHQMWRLIHPADVFGTPCMPQQRVLAGACHLADAAQYTDLFKAVFSGSLSCIPLLYGYYVQSTARGIPTSMIPHETPVKHHCTTIAQISHLVCQSRTCSHAKVQSVVKCKCTSGVASIECFQRCCRSLKLQQNEI